MSRDAHRSAGQATNASRENGHHRGPGRRGGGHRHARSYGAVPGSHRMAAGNARLEAESHLAEESNRTVMARITHLRAVENDRRTPHHERPAPDVLDEAERKFLEPVARYLAILQEWALERPDEACSSPPPEGP